MVNNTPPRYRREPIRNLITVAVKQGSDDLSKHLSDILVLLEAKVSKKRRREPGRAKYLTNDSVLEEMKSKVKEKEKKEEEKRAKALEREEKRPQKELKLEIEQKKRQKEESKSCNSTPYH